jgi:hypothetical protein
VGVGRERVDSRGFLFPDLGAFRVRLVVLVST